jgi:cytochrome bd ubiquinol oxidase subunit II
VSLIDLWFVIIAVLWIGFFFLDGFDFGVGAISSFIGRDDAEKETILRTIGPTWDADEVWLITGGIAIFGAFPLWYATVFPAAYIPLVLVIVGIIVRGVSIEYRSKRPEHPWRQRWDTALGVSSVLLPLLFGVFWAGMLHGIPLDADGAFTGRSLLSFLNPYSLLGGVTLLVFSLAHGAAFLVIKTNDPLRSRMRSLAVRLSVLTTVLIAGFSAWTYLAYSDGDTVALVVGVLATVAMAVSVVAQGRGAAMWAFWLDGVAVAGFVTQIFIGLYPYALRTSESGGASLLLTDAAAGQLSLQVMTVTAAIGLPLVIAYQAWSFWVFRNRLKPAPTTADVTSPAQ